MEINEMRKAFEATNSRDHRRQPPKGNNYIDPMAQADWESFQKGWKASREAVVVELPSPITDTRWHGEYRRGQAAMYDTTKSTIEAQGLKVKP